MGYAGNYRYFTYASWVLSAVSALVALVPFVYIWKILWDVLNAAPNYAQAVNIPHYGWMAVLFAVLAYLIYIAALMCSHLSAFRVATNLRLAVSEHLAVLPLGFAETFGSGKLRKIIHESTGAAETYLAHQLPDQYNAIATPVGLLVLLLAFDWRLGLLSLAPVVLAFLIMVTMTGKRMAEKMRQYDNALEAMSNEAVEYVRGIPVVKTFGQSVFSFKKFKATIDEYEKWVVSYTKDLRLPMMFYTAAVNGVFAFLIAGGLLFTAHGVTPEFLLNLLFYIIITPVISLTLTRMMYMSESKMVVADALARIDSVLEAVPMQVQAVPQYPKDSSVTLQDVHFSYDGKTEVIKGVSLEIQPGQTVAFVGPSGGGKSTLANLVCRFFDVQSGSVRVGGADVRDIPKEELMDTISFVFQNSRLLKGSILDNVRLGRPQTTEAEVLAALKAAQCMDIVEKFPAGIHTVIGTKGVYLSGGEQQRIAIARAMLKKAPILILDEATAFADPDNEAKVQAAFAQLAKGKTVLMIAHRLSTIANADCIYVVQDGQIAESGTKDGTYFTTYKESGTRRLTLAERLRKLPLSFFGKRDLADLTSTIMSDCEVLEKTCSHFIPGLFGSLISTVIIALSLFAFDWRMALAALWVIPVSIAIVLGSYRVQDRIQARTMAVKMDCADGIQEYIETLRDLKASNAEQGYLSGLSKKIRAVEKQSVAAELETALFVSSAGMVLKLGIALVALTGSVLLVQGSIDVLTLFLFLMAASRMYDPMQGALQNLAAVIAMRTNVGRMNEILDAPLQTGSEQLTNQGCDIVFDHVGFAYNSGETVLRDVSFTAKQGEVTALVGPSGGGKTTVSRLAARFWDYQKGSITVGGMEVSRIDPEKLMSLYSIVFQDVTLFDNTILENIRLGRKGATDEEVLAAAKLANCEEFAEKLPDKWNTNIGENGCALSGGERQRISIARAFLKDAPIILLDEATASLDVENETAIQEALSRLIKNKTVLIIAHRMRTVAGADQVVVLSSGIVAEQGSPAELYARKGLYTHMVDLQSASQNWTI